jgi:hypothetical protein
MLYTDVPVCSRLFKAASHIESLLELCSAILLTGKKLQLSTNKWSKYLQGTPLTPMDISPQQYTEEPASAPTPPPQPQFTPQAAAPSNPSFQFSFGANSSSDVPKQAGAKHTPKGRRSAAALPRSRFVPPNATDTSTGFSTFGSSAQAQASSASTAGAAGFDTAFGATAQAQQGTAGAAGLGSAFGAPAQAQPSTASTAGFGTAQAQPSTAGAAGFGSASGTTAQAQPGTAGFGSAFAQAQPSNAGTAGFAEHSAPRPAAPNGFATKPAAPSGFSASGTGAFTSSMPFSVPGRPMDSRISDACAMGLFGINLDSTAVQSATAQAAAAPTATAGASAATAGAHPTQQQPPGAAAVPGSYGTSSSFAAGSTEGGNAKRDQPSASCTAPAQQDPFGTGGFFAAPAEGQPPTAGQAAQPSPTPFTMGAGTIPAHHSGRPLYGSEHLATNLHDKLVLEEQLAAATQAEAAQAATSHPERFQPSAADSGPFSAAAAAAAAANGAAGSASTSSEAAQLQAQQQAAQQSSAGSTSAASAAAYEAAQAQQQAAQQSAAGSTSAASAAAPAAAAPAPFIFGSSAASAANHAAADAAGRAAQSQPQGFSLGTAHSFPAQQAAAQPAGGRADHSQPQGFSFGTARSFPAQQAAAQPAPSQPFVFGASATSLAASGAAATQTKDGANFPPAGGSQAGWPQAAPFSTASAATSEAPLHFAPSPVNTNSIRTGLHSPSGVAKHTNSRGNVSGAGQHGRPVPGSPHARRTRPTPRKQPHPQVRAYSNSIQSNLHHECIYNNGNHLSHSLLTIIQIISP